MGKNTILTVFCCIYICIINGCDRSKIKNEQTPQGIHVEIPESKYLFPTISGSVIIYGRPVGQNEIVADICIFGDEKNILNLLEVLCGTKKFNFKEIFQNTIISNPHENEIYVLNILSLISLDGQSLNKQLKYYYVRYHNNIDVNVFKLIQTKNNIDFKIKHLSEKECIILADKIKRRIKSKRIKINNKGIFHYPFSSTKSIITFNKPKKVLYGSYLFSVDGSVTNKNYTDYFTKGIGFISRVFNDNNNAINKENFIDQCLFYKEFYNEGGDFVSNNKFLGSRIVYFFIPEKNKKYEFYDKHFFIKSKDGAIFFKKVK